MESYDKPKKKKWKLCVIWILTLSLLLGLIYGIFIVFFNEEDLAINEPSDFSNEEDHLYRWDLSVMYKTIEEAKRTRDRLSQRIDYYKAYEGKLGDSGRFKEAILEREQILIELEKLLIYGSLAKDADSNNKEADDFVSSINGLKERADEAFSFMENELSKLSSEKLDTYMNYSESKGSQWFLGSIRYEKERVNSKYEEGLLSILESMEPSVVEPYDSFWSQFEVEQDEEVLKDYYSSDDEKRKLATKESLKKSIEGSEILASILEGKIQYDNSLAKAYGYASDLEMVIGQDGLTKEQFEKVKAISEKNMNLMHRWITYKKNKLKLNRPLAFHDRQLELGRSEIYDFNQGRKMVEEALKPLGTEVLAIYERAFKERWIDVYPRESKHKGDYTWGAYASHPFVLINYEENFDSVDVLAHEMGHAIQGQLSNQSQSFENASSGIFKAEIASTTNEVLFLEYALKNLKGEALREAQEAYVELFAGTLFEQMKATEFEITIHEAKLNGQNLNAAFLNETWRQLNKKYYGSDYQLTELDGYDWTSLDHLYWNFYMYKYATGLTSGYNLAQKILQENDDTQKQYLDFLKSGSSKDAVEEIKLMGISLDSESCYEKMDWLLGQLEVSK